jgi:hypothetical protein
MMAAFRISRSTDLVLLGLLAAAVLICAVAIAPILWTAAKEVIAHQADFDPRACLTIANESDRLHCLETRVGRETPPAKGAYAPPAAFGEKDHR